MKKSESIANIAKALSGLQSEIENPKKTEKNPHFGCSYAPLESVLDAGRPLLSKYGLSIIQNTPTKGKEVIINTIIMHESGEWIETCLKLPATAKAKEGKERFDSQSIGAAITYGRRYSLQPILFVNGEHDDDGNGQVVEPKASEKQINYLKKLAAKNIKETENYLKKNKIKVVDDCSIKQASELIGLLQDAKKKTKDDDFSYPNWVESQNYDK